MTTKGDKMIQIHPSQTLFCSGRLRWVRRALFYLILPITRKRRHKTSNLRLRENCDMGSIT